MLLSRINVHMQLKIGEPPQNRGVSGRNDAQRFSVLVLTDSRRTDLMI